MKLAFSTNAFTRFSLLDAVNAIADAGFEAVEILADVPHAYPATITPAEIAELRGVLDRRSIAVSNVNANCNFGYWKDAPPEPYFEPSLISPNPRHRSDRAELIYGAMNLAHEIGARNMSITSGKCLGPMSPDLAMKQLTEQMLPILERADTLGIDIGIELEPGLFMEYATELREWIGRMDHPRLGANLDIGHSVVIGERIDEAVQTLAGRIWNVHVEDLPGRKHYHQIPGTGTFDWTLLGQSLQGIEYDRCITVELYTQSADPVTAARRSFEFLSERLMAGQVAR